MPATPTDLNYLEQRVLMLSTIFILLIVLWALGMLSGYSLGGLIHLLLVVAIIVFVARLVLGRRRLA
jgi:uncharacterized protein DUF5670